ncbi:tetratricopeptide repeat protein [Chitinophaga polysaccharea]|uniref:tetratricopeptide repeat protein n=1 Tax=Chitinophaga TaxID=79328 RepID=UPI00145509F3|nr:MULTISPECIES: tetratricopeptide repeat protein [Chitinophaga]NLR62317.1 tetratricopeptide repeat protein [Chitinophaga polysaccharea]NLU95773.1 tetratricopeptide repeat protein [Chitinophaga sp. Ak27]
MKRLLPFLTLYLLLLPLFTHATGEPVEGPITLTAKPGRQSPDSAFLALRKMQETAMANGDELTAGKCLQQMGKICFTLGHYAKSLEYYQQAATIFGAQQHKSQEAAVLNDMGELYYRNINKKAAKTHYDKALQLYRQINDKSGMAATYGYIGHYYEKQSQYDSAWYFQQLALTQYQNAKDTLGMAGIYENLGTIHEDLTKYDAALACFRTALQLYDLHHEHLAGIEVINNIGDILRKTGAYKQSMPYSKEALAIARHTNNKYQEAAACKDIAKTFNLMGQHDSAYYYMEWSRKCLLEIYSAENNQQMNFLQIIYDTNKKNDEIMQLENSHHINRIIYISVGVVVVLLIMLCLLTISRQKLKISQAQAVSERNAELNRIQKDQLELKSKQLATHTLDVIQRNQFLDELRNTLSGMVQEDKRDQKKQLQQLVLKINQNVNHEKQWKDFTGIFEQVHQVFFDKLNALYSDLTNNDIKLLALHKMNMDSKDMATILGISPDSLRVARYRLRKKLNIPEGDTLSTFVQTL